MKKYGSWTELAALVLRTPTNSAQVTIDAADAFTAGSYTFTIPNSANDEFVLRDLGQVLRTKTLKQPIFTDASEAAAVTINPAAADTAGTLNLDLNNGARSLTLDADVNFAGAFNTGAGTLTLNPTTTSTLTLPNNTTGTVVVDDEPGQTLTSKVMTDLRYTEQAIASAGSVASDGSTILRLTGSPVNLTDITGVSTSGTIKVLENGTSGSLNILETGNITTGTGGALTLEQGTSVTIYYDGSGWKIIGGSGSGAGGLKLQDLDFTTWDVATPPNYEAAAGTHYLIDSSGGAMTIYLPSENQDGDVIRFTDASGSWAIGGTTNLFIAPHSGGIIDGLAIDETLELDITSSWIQFMWDEGQSKWVSDDPLSPSGLSWLNVEGLSGALTAETDKHYIATGSGAYTVTLPAGSDGFVMRISDSTQNFALNPITVTPNGSEQIDDYAPGESLVLDVKGIWVQFMWDGTQWLTDDPIAPSNIPSITGTTGGMLYSDGGDVANTSTGTVGVATWDAAGGKLTLDSETGANQLVLTRSTTYAGLSWDTTISDFGGGGGDLIWSSTGNNTGYGFRTRDGTGTQKTALVLNPDGNVGIGTENPNLTLQVNGPMGGNWASKSVTANSTAVTISDVFSAQITGAGASRTNCTLSTSGAVAGQVVHLYGHTWSVQFIESTTATFAGGSSITLGNTAGNLAGITLIYNGGKWIEVARGGTY